MHLRSFTYYRPSLLSEVVKIIQTSDPGELVLMGGGTDVMVKMKMRLINPRTVIRLRDVPELTKIEQQGNVIYIGAATNLNAIKESSLIQRFFPALVQAVGRIGSPQLRTMGTLGGNVCLDTRCLYYNQQNWPGTFPPCFKKGGDRCHVVRKGSRCYALFCADSPAVLLTLGACLQIVGPTGKREIPMTEFYQDDGLCYHQLQKNELIIGITIPINQNMVTSYSRISMRKAIDFPVVGVAVAMERSSGKEYKNFRIAATGLQSRPLRLSVLEKMMAGGDGVLEELRQVIRKGIEDIRPLPHQGISGAYRKDLLRALIEESLVVCTSREREVK